MLLFLVRHGEAVRADTADSYRALTPEGAAEVEEMASHLEAIRVSTDIIFHSTKARAKQTAGIFARYLNPAKGMTESPDLGPMTDPMLWAERLNTMDEKVMIVGHLPYMSRIASLLISGFASETAVTFTTASVACLRRDHGAWSLLWLITPEIIGEGCRE
jgi:phosphohistidine phosphatase